MRTSFRQTRVVANEQMGVLDAWIGVYRRGTEVRPRLWGRQMRVKENMRVDRRGTGRKHGRGGRFTRRRHGLWGWGT